MSSGSEGDETWQCDQCGNSNDVESWPCEKCRYPLVRDANVKKKVEGAFRNTEGTITRPPSDNWECIHCKRINNASHSRCNTCFTNRTSSQIDKNRAAATGKRLQQSMDGIYKNLISSVEADNLELDIPTKRDRNWLKRSGKISDDEDIHSDIKVRDLIGEHPRACDVGGAIVLHHGTENRSYAGVLFRVLAPNAEKVAVVGDWNDWKPWEDYLVHEGEYWQTIVPTARPGQKYNYIVQYYDEKAKKKISQYRADPRGEILHFSSKRWCNEIYDQKYFKWTDNNHKRRNANEMILYELHIGSFMSSGCSSKEYNDACEFPARIGTFNEISENLKYFQDLGVNTLALLPITQDSHRKPFNCWGYDPVSLWAVHRDYGTPDELKNLINSAHLLGISVILDFVPNHLAGQNILNFYDGPEDIYFPKDLNIKRTDWGPRLDFGSKKVRNYVIDAAESWLRDFHFDGIRVDSTCNIRGYSLDGQSQIHPDGWILLQELTDMIRLKFPGCISIAEDLQDYESKLNHGGAGFDSQWDDRFFSAVLQSVVTVSDTQRNARDLAEAICMASLPGCTAGGRVIFTESHDTVPSDRQGRIPAAILRGNRAEWPLCSDVETNFYSLKRTALSLAILMTSPGIPMLLQGQELFETCAPTWPFGPLVDFTRNYRMDPPGGFYKYCKDLCMLRRNENETTKGLTGNYARAYHLNDSDDNRVLGIHRWTHGGPTDDVIVIINCCNIYYDEYWLGLPRYGTWQLRFNSDSTEYSSSFIGAVHDESIDAVKSPKDGYPYSGCVTIAPYTVLIYSQNAKSTVKFGLKHKLNGEKLLIVGNIPALGCWDPALGLALEKRGEQDLWESCHVSVASNQLVEFKFVIQNSNQIFYWQVGENVYFVPDSGNRNYQVDCQNIVFE